MNLKVFGKSTVIYAFSNMGLRAASFLLIPIYTHNLSVSDYGLLSTIFISSEIIMVVMSLGMRSCLQNYLKEHASESSLDILLGTTTVINLLAGAAVTAACFYPLRSFFENVFHMQDIGFLLGMTCILGLLQSLTLHLTSLYRSFNQPVRFMFTGFASALSQLVLCAVLLMVYRMGLSGALWAGIVSQAGVLAFLVFDIVLHYGFRVSPRLIPVFLSYGTPLVLAMTSTFVMTGASMYFLSYFGTLEEVAVYSLGFKFSQILAIVIILPFQLAFEPFVFNHIDEPDIGKKIARILTYLVFTTLLMSLMILVASWVLIPVVAPPEYASAYLVVLWMVPAAVSIGVNYYGQTILSAARKTHRLGTIMVTFALIAVALNYLLIPSMRWKGAVIAVNITNFLSAMSLFAMANKHFEIPIEWGRLGLIVTTFAVLFAASYSFLPLGGVAYLAILSGMLLLYASLAPAKFFKSEEETLFIQSATSKLKSYITG